MKRQGFTLVELMIVVAILGILAAIVLPQYANSSQQASESAVKDMLYTVRSQIELYKMQHSGLTPGYWSSVAISGNNLYYQLIGTSKSNGVSTATQTPAGDYLYGPYLMQLPKNPFNDKTDITVVADGTTDFSAVANDASGWLYERTTGTFKINKSGTDSDGTAYVDY